MPPLATSDTYRSVRDATIRLVADAGATGDEPVPACPGWTVRDVMAHLVGLAASWLDGDLEVYASDEWTARQVARWADHDIVELSERWVELGDRLADEIDDLERVDRLPPTITTVIGPAPLSTFATGIVIDALQHEHDISGALGVSTDDHEFLPALTRLLVRSAGTAWRRAGHEPVAVWSTDHGEVGELGVGDPTRTVRGTTIDLFRSLGGRRTTAQIAELDWEPDVAPRLDEFVVRFFRAPAVPVEPVGPG